MTAATRVVPIRGRHLLDFECIYCGHVEHEQALQIGELLICWTCLCRVTLIETDGEGDYCPRCYPATCPAPECAGVVFHNAIENSEHIRALHPVRFGGTSVILPAVG